MFEFKIYMVNTICQKALLYIYMYEISSFSHYRLAAMYVKNCPNFWSVFRQPFSAARPDRPGSYKTEEIFHIGITRALKIRAGFHTKKG